VRTCTARSAFGSAIISARQSASSDARARRIFCTSAQSVGQASERYWSKALRPGRVCVMRCTTSKRAPSSIAMEMKVCLVPWTRRGRIPSASQSALSWRNTLRG